MRLFGNKEIEVPSDQSEEERKLVTHVKSKVEEIRSSANRIAHEGIWMTNIAYLLGYDGVAFNSTTRQFQPINRSSSYLKKNRIHVNKILPTIQNRLARLCKNPPKYDVRPESNNTEDKEAARLGLQTLSCLWEQLTLDKKRLFLYMWVQQTGHAYVKISWDGALGKFMTDPMTNEPGFEGDVRADVVSPFEIFPDPAAKTDDDVYSTWLIQCKVRKLDYFKMHYPERGELVKEEAAWLLSSQYEQRINSLNSRGPSQGGTFDQIKNSAIEMIKYEARSKDYPNGRMIVCANGILLEDKELPCGEIPFAKFDDVIIGGKYYSECTVTHLRPVQDQFNETVRRRAEWTRKLLAGKYKAPRGSNLQQESVNDESGEIVYFDPVPVAGQNGPEPIQIPMIPQWAYAEEDKLNLMFNDIAGINDPSKGIAPGAQMPAIGMQLLVEQDDTRIGVMTEQHEHAWARVGHLILEYVQQYYTMPRKLKIAGKNLQYTVKEVVGSDLKGNTDVTVIRGSTLPGSKTLRRQEILNTYQQGLLGDPQDPKVREKVLGMIEFGDVAEMWEDYGLDMAQIDKAIKSIEGGQMPEINEADNHAMWYLQFNRYRKGDKFASLSPELQSMIDQVMQESLHWMLQLSNAVPPTDSEGRPLGAPLPPPTDLGPPPEPGQPMMGGPPGAGAPMPPH